MDEKVTIVVIAYNRPISLQRLLNSLDRAQYFGQKVRLHISIDFDKNRGSKNQEVVEIAKKFIWRYGEKIVDYKKQNLGLRKHVLECGNLTQKYENIIMLEDDIVVSPLMYSYSKQALEFYKDEEAIGGFGLYKFERNQYVNEPFYPLNDGCDVFFAQVACSWGQMWTKRQWSDFYEWYLKNKEEGFEKVNIPVNIKKWSDKSWLKYYMKYLVETKKYFVYPQMSFATNFTDIGTHNKKSDISYQTLLATKANEDISFRFERLEDSKVVYDSFFENQRINKMLNSDQEIECDFYGSKDIQKITKGLLLSSRAYPHKILKQFDTIMYPYEQNIINDIEGNSLFLYDMNAQDITKEDKNLRINHFRYVYRIGNMDGKMLKCMRKCC